MTWKTEYERTQAYLEVERRLNKELGEKVAALEPETKP